MAVRFELWQGVRRVVAGYRQNRIAVLQIFGGALVIAIAIAAAPSAGQAPAGSGPEARQYYGSTQPPGGKPSILRQVAHGDLFRLLGKEVRSTSDEAMGRVVDVLVDEAGRPRAAIIDFGGFLGVGTRKIAIDWAALRFDAAGQKNAIAVDLARDQIKSAPQYKDSHEIVAIVTAQPETSNRGW
jgi:PRC-barrel domain